jgi:antitoxin VapB
MRGTRIAKLFKNGASQAVRLPSEFRFPGDEVYISRDETTGNVVLSTSPGVDAWERFFDLRNSADIPDDFMKERPMNRIPQERNIFEEER